MKSSVQNLLKKINYIEAEVEIQKQILFSIPSGNEKDIEEVIEKIAHAKDEIVKLRKEIEAISPEEYQRIVKIEEASETFKKIAAEEKFTTVASMSTEEACSILLNNGKELPCLIKAKDEGGNWTVITLDGDIRQFGCDQVKTNA
jgi:MoaA/NifB/PqqE/SkfB family radical SAM enzyme